MCQLKSCLVLKNRVFCPAHDSHQNMLEELGIEDNEVNAMKTFVRVELTPPETTPNYFDDKYFTSLQAPLSEWKLVVDQDILPDWWEPAIYRLAIEKEVQKWLNKYVLINQEKKTIVGNGHKDKYYLYNCKYIVLIDTNSIMKNCSAIWCEGGNSIIAIDSELSSGETLDNQYYIYGCSTLNAHNETPVWAYDKSCVCSYVGNVYLRDNAICKASGRTNVIAEGKPSVIAYDNAIVRAYGETNLTLHHKAIAIIYSPTVKHDIIDESATLIKKFDK